MHADGDEQRQRASSTADLRLTGPNEEAGLSSSPGQTERKKRKIASLSTHPKEVATTVGKIKAGLVEKAVKDLESLVEESGNSSSSSFTLQLACISNIRTALDELESIVRNAYCDCRWGAQFPPELFALVCSFLLPGSLLAVERCCKTWQRSVNADNIWTCALAQTASFFGPVTPSIPCPPQPSRIAKRRLARHARSKAITLQLANASKR